MKKLLLFLLIISLLFTSLAACKKNVPPSEIDAEDQASSGGNENDSDESSDTEIDIGGSDSDSGDEDKETDTNKAPAYSLTYVSNGDGTCYVSDITINPDFTEEYVLEIPEKASNGDTVTAVKMDSFDVAIPTMLLAEDFEALIEKIEKNMENVTDKEELFRFTQFKAYYDNYSLDDIIGEDQILIDTYLDQYPIVTVADVYLLSPNGINSMIANKLFNFLEEYADFTVKDTATYYENLNTAVNESNVENKAEILESLPNATALPYNIISIRVADTVKEIPLTLFSSCTTLKELIIPSCIKTIPERGFTKHPNITTVTISESVTSIEDLAFEDCSNLTSINIPSNVTNIGYSAFSGCSSLARVTIGNGVTSIGSHAFDNCSSLASINIPNSVTSIGDQTFRGCSSLANITVDAVNPNYKSIDGNLYSKDGKTLIRYAIGKTATSIAIPEGVTDIGDCAFEDCSNLTTINIPNSVTNIGYAAFSGCNKLTKINIPDSITNIDSKVFSGCNNLTYTEYNNGKYLGNGENPYVVLIDVMNTSTTNFTIPNTTKIIYEYAFSGYSILMSINIPDSVKQIGAYAFSRCISLTSVTIGNSVTNIGYAAFSGCSSLASIDIPDGVRNISDFAFSSCSSLANVTIGNLTMNIGNEAFSYCQLLTSINIPNSVTNIGSSAFYYCSNLTDITFSGTKDDWNGLEKGPRWDHLINSYTVHCTDGDITQ